MSTIYLDSSAFIKVVIEEPESAALRSYLGSSAARRTSSSLLRTEAMRAVRHQGDDAHTAVREGIRRIDLIAIDDRLLAVAGLLEPGILRTLDAIHVATALAVGDDLDAIVSYDTRMLEAATLLGLPTATPR